VFGIWKNYLRSGRNLLLYQFKRRGIKLTVVIIEECHCYELHKKCPISFIKVKPKYRLNYWGSALWVSI
jgi:hypothetical protein